MRQIKREIYNKEHNIIPTPAGKKANNSILSFLELSRRLQKDVKASDLVKLSGDVANELLSTTEIELTLDALPELIEKLELRMKEAAKDLDFEEAANLRDEIESMQKNYQGYEDTDTA